MRGADMAGGPNAASVMCILCTERAERTSEGVETDRYRCTACGQTFLVNWDESQPSAPCWPPRPEDVASLKAVVATRSRASASAPLTAGAPPAPSAAAD